jgi:ABC-type multidrug transport system permease subunit
MAGGWRVIGRMTGSLLLEEARSPAGMFWMLLFPAFLFVLFGFLFGASELRNRSFRVGVDRALESSEEVSAVLLRRALAGSSIIGVDWLEEAAGRRLLAEGKLHALVTRVAGERAYTVLVTEKDKPFGTVLSSVLERASVDAVRRFLRGPAPFDYRLEVLAVGGRRLTYLYFLFAGTLGLSVMLNCFFAIPQTIIGYRRQGFLKRFACTPLRRVHFTLGLVLQRVVIGLAQIGLLATTGALVFGLRFASAPLSFLPVFLLGTATFAAAGFFLAGLLSTVEAAVAVAQIFAMLFMFTSGLFVPVELIPRPFAQLAVVNPVLYFSRAVFSSMVLGRGPLEMGPDLGALAVFFAGFLLLTVLTFRYQRTP